jgi:hypothetical protein
MMLMLMLMLMGDDKPDTGQIVQEVKDIVPMECVGKGFGLQSNCLSPRLKQPWGDPMMQRSYCRTLEGRRGVVRGRDDDDVRGVCLEAAMVGRVIKDRHRRGSF